MNVLVLSQGLPNPLNVNHWIFVAEQVKALSEHCNITAIAPVLVPRPGRKFREQRQLAAQIPYAGKLNRATYYRPCYLDLPRFSLQLNDYLMLASILWCIARHRIKVDLIHAHFAYRPGYVGGILGRILSKPVVLTVWGSDINVVTREDYEIPLKRKRTLAALRLTNHIIAVSKALRHKVVGLGIRSDKVSVIYNAISRQRFYQRPQNESRGKLDLPLGRHIILFVGNLVPIKAVDVLIKALALLGKDRGDIHLVVLGDGLMRNELEQLADELELKNIEFRGRRCNQEIPLYMSAADFLVLPSMNEGCPTVMLETLACGTPIVASRVGGIPEVVTNHELGILVEPGNVRALAYAIEKAVKTEWNSRVMMSHVQPYTRQRIARQTYELYVYIVREREGASRTGCGLTSIR